VQPTTIQPITAATAPLEGALSRLESGLLGEIATANVRHAEALAAHDHASARQRRREVNRALSVLRDIANFRD
jgi:hypothetical protein